MDIRDWELKRGYVEVNLDYIYENIHQIKQHIRKDTKIIAVIKADGYGHGSVPIAKTLEKLDYLFGFAVATAEEALTLRKEGIKKPVLILGLCFPYAYPKLIKEKISVTVSRSDLLDALGRSAQEMGREALIHIKVDTGMGRIGIMPDEEGIHFIQKAIHTPGIKVEGIFTHFACADMEDLSFAKEQLNIFQQFVQKAETGLKQISPTGSKLPQMFIKKKTALSSMAAS